MADSTEDPSRIFLGIACETFLPPCTRTYKCKGCRADEKVSDDDFSNGGDFSFHSRHIINNSKNEKGIPVHKGKCVGWSWWAVS